MRILSIDCGNKSLGVCLYEADPDFLNDFFADNPINKPIIHFVDSYNLIPECKKVTDSDILTRTARLKAALDHIMKRAKGSVTDVLIEYQMVHNNKTSAQSSQIIMYFTKPDYNFEYNEIAPKQPKIIPVAPNIHIVKPTHKNQISYGEIKHYTYVAKYAGLEAANKAHCKAMFVQYCEDMKLDYHLKCKPAVLRDLADAFCQALAWYIKVTIAATKISNYKIWLKQIEK